MPTRNAPQTGEVWDARLSPTVGGEQSGSRPVLVVSNVGFNGLRNDLYIVMPVSGRVSVATLVAVRERLERFVENEPVYMEEGESEVPD